MINAFDIYRSLFFSGTEYCLKPVLATNGRIPKALARLCMEKEIELINGEALSELLVKKHCTHADVEFMEATRMISMSQFYDIVSTHR
jgi:hypothetical protein